MNRILRNLLTPITGLMIIIVLVLARIKRYCENLNKKGTLSDTNNLRKLKGR